ncbi:ATP-dependent DNA helicase [Paenibacillus sp. GCM10023252]|uniref:ATP-dependent DNA helicase n=1 Tax=Paenibacillus sp. GCM10023252 TaxID=3252649 RepID=UPI00360A23E9
MRSTVHIAVRPLVEYVCRSGSIESGFRTATALTEGTKAHQKVQKQYGEQDQSEVYVKAEIPYEDLLFVVDGRCDGLLREEQPPGTPESTDCMLTIDEIKSTSHPLTQMTEQGYAVHWAQARFYAYMVAKDQGLERIRVQLTYVRVNSDEQRRFAEESTLEELEAFVYGILRSYAPYAKLLAEHEQRRNNSIAELAFPFPQYREGQRKFAGSVYKSIENGSNLFAKAPTGTGKTISTTFPSVKAIGSGTLQRLFYLTAKTITRTAVEEACHLMQSQGLHMHTITLTAKDKICFKEEAMCDKRSCQYADGYYDRVNEGMLDMLSNETIMTRTVVAKYAKKHTLCPFELSLDTAYAADVIICDYNYIFDPRVSLKRLFGEQRKQTALLIDEAHNLVDRAREMYSATIHKSAFLELQREMKAKEPDVHRAAKAVNDYFIALRKSAEEGQRQLVRKELPEELITLLEAFIAAGERVLAGGGQGAAEQLLLDCYFTAQNMVRTSKLYDERYVTLTEVTRSEVQTKLMCLDPAHNLQGMAKGFRSQIYFSATLSPLTFYMEMLGAGPEDYTVTIPSPFRKEQLDVAIMPLSTRFHDRERSKEPLVALINKTVAERPGNYLVFFPSYAYMNDVYESFVLANREVDHMMQGMGMSEEDRESFLEEFQAGKERTLVAFAVMGGIFSEGIDLVGDRLNGVIVVGVGMPQLGPERDLMKEYYNETGRRGFDYAYVFPGMNKVLQAGGRLIRSEQDHGTLILVDDRYLQPQYQRLLPEEWQHYRVLV